MFAAKIELDIASRFAETGASVETLRTALVDATRSANEAMVAIRGVCADLREFSLEDVDVLGDLTGLLGSFERKTGAQCLLAIRCECSGIERAAANKIRRTVREKLDEMASTSGVRRVRVEIRAGKRQYGLQIRFDKMAEPPERMTGRSGLRTEAAPGSIKHSGEAETGAAAAVGKSVFIVKIPRGSRPESDSLPSR
jgi:signal transduction histidine kinase